MFSILMQFEIFNIIQLNGKSILCLNYFDYMQYLYFCLYHMLFMHKIYFAVILFHY